METMTESSYPYAARLIRVEGIDEYNVALEWEPNMRSDDNQAIHLWVQRRRINASGVGQWENVPGMKFDDGAIRSNTSRTDNQCNPGTTYQYRIAKQNRHSQWSYSDVAEATTRRNCPNSVKNFEVERTDMYEMTLTWENNHRTDNFRATRTDIYKRRLFPPDPGTGIGTLVKQFEGTQLGTNLWRDPNCAAEATYEYTIYKVDGDNGVHGTNSDPVTVRPIPPNPAGNFSVAIVNGTNAELKWTNNYRTDQYKATRTDIYRKRISPNPGGPVLVQQLCIANGDPTTWTDESCDANTTYEYLVYKVNDNYIASDPAGPIQVTTGEGRPNSVTDFTVELIGQARLKLTWVNNNRTDKYKATELQIYRRRTYPTPEAAGRLVETYRSVGLGQGSWTDVFVMLGETYEYTIVKKNDQDLLSEEVMASSYRPNPVSGFRGDYRENKVDLAWQNNHRTDSFRATEMKISRREISPNPGSTMAIKTFYFGQIDTESWTDYSVIFGRVYEYTMYKTNLNRAPSETATIEVRCE